MGSDHLESALAEGKYSPAFGGTGEDVPECDKGGIQLGFLGGQHMREHQGSREVVVGV